jgi:positive regulator of sigma E activity
MKDKGKIISLKGPFAQIKLDCVSGCQKCAARHLFSNKKYERGLFKALNPVKAAPGDEVMIDIPEEKYNKALIMLFGLMLFASLLGMLLGFFTAAFFPFPPPTGGMIGFFLGLVIAGLFLFVRIKKMNLYPEIISIIKEGDYHE